MHLKRITMPKSWFLPKKEQEFIIKSRGPHPLKNSIPLLILLRDFLKIVTTRKEAKKILHEGNVLIDNQIIKDEKFTIGLFDRLYIKKMEKMYTIILTDKGYLKAVVIKKERYENKPCKIIGKKILKGNKTQINLYDGKNFIIDKKFEVGGSIILDIKTNKIKDYLKFAKDSNVLITGGKHKGVDGKIVEISSLVIVKTENNKEIKVPKKYIFVVEKKEFEK